MNGKGASIMRDDYQKTEGFTDTNFELLDLGYEDRPCLHCQVGCRPGAEDRDCTLRKEFSKKEKKLRESGLFWIAYDLREIYKATHRIAELETIKLQRNTLIATLPEEIRYRYFPDVVVDI